ncbi:FliH/SctL family protein [Paraferrimonas sp. SM1919]|uniref:FliH/SctL family protein n=1 Tax=Paraferrimonas sp. SM1919 TaxID=2662263 RepID=UPI0013D4A398|nr:FliH/SctL family protein [Paraferrimonas sp. SM1919]
MNQPSATEATLWHYPDFEQEDNTIEQQGVFVRNEAVAEEVIDVPTPEQIEQIRLQAQQQGHQQGFEEGRQQGYEQGQQLGQQQGFEVGQQQGLAQGLEQGQQQIERRLEQLQGLIDSLQHPLEHIDSYVLNSINEVINDTCTQILQQELQPQSKVIIAQIKKALSKLDVAHNDINIHCSEEDFEPLTLQLETVLKNTTIKLVIDTSLHPGQYQIKQDFSLIDIDVEQLIHQAQSQLKSK